MTTWHGLLFLFGGGEYGKTFNDVWAIDLNTLEDKEGIGWRQLRKFNQDVEARSEGQPVGRSGHSAVLLAEHYLYILGGCVCVICSWTPLWTHLFINLFLGII